MISKLFLFPYYLTLKTRNLLYDNGIKKSVTCDIPVISIGNITVGGTGKTPMAEYIINVLSKEYRLAVISRGYKRKSKGFVIVNSDDSARKVGDEPLQIKRKFPDVLVIVDKDRLRAIKQIKALPDDTKPDVIILDDAFQYRKLIPMKNLVLIDYNRPIFKDNLLPIGKLRDLPEQLRRADGVVLTKSPEYLDQWEVDKAKQVSRVRHSQPLFFSKIKYCSPQPVFKDNADNRYIYSKEVYLFSGIANDNPIIAYLSGKYDSIFHKSFADHHVFTRADIAGLKMFAKHHPRALLLTTEKDAQRLFLNPYINDDVKTRLFYLPIENEFLTAEGMKAFNDYLFKGLPEPRRTVTMTYAGIASAPAQEETEHKAVQKKTKPATPARTVKEPAAVRKETEPAAPSAGDGLLF